MWLRLPMVNCCSPKTSADLLLGDGGGVLTLPAFGSGITAGQLARGKITYSTVQCFGKEDVVFWLQPVNEETDVETKCT